MDRPLILAHRGARRAAPENTLEAFRLARSLGADGVELDVRRTADGALVLSHDPTLGAGTGRVDPIVELDFATLRAKHAATPTLAEALDECSGLLVNIEIKNLPWEPDFDATETVADAVVALLAPRRHTDRILVSSFHLPTIDRVHEANGDVATGLLFIAGADPRLMTDLAADRGHRAIHPDIRALDGETAAGIVGHAHGRGLQVNVWTVNERDDIVRCAALGVDRIVTDVPDVARDVLSI